MGGQAMFQQMIKSSFGKSVLALIALAAFGAAEARAAAAYVTTPAGVRKVDFLCETDAREIYAVAFHGPQVEVLTYLKGSPHLVAHRIYDTQSDGAMGHIHYPLTVHGRPAGEIIQVNPYSTPLLESVAIPQTHRQDCRIIDGVRFYGFGTRRAVLVTADAAGRLSYRSFNYPHGQGVSLSGGQKFATPMGVEYRFTAGAYTYLVRQPAGAGQAEIEVIVQGHALPAEPQIGYFVAP